MLRQHENSVSLKAGLYAAAVHLGLLATLLISFNWKTTHPMNIAQVELWDSIPAPIVATREPTAVPLQPVPEVVAPAPTPVLEKTPEPEPAVDIALEKKQLEEKKRAEKKLENQVKETRALEQKKKLAEIQAALLQDEAKEKTPKKPSQNDALKKLQQDALADDKATGDQQQSAAKASATAGTVNEYKTKIQAKIRANVNKTLCGEGNPQLVFDIALLPTGELSTNPKLAKSSGSVACDDAVERAIIASQPLPLPSDNGLFTQFRNLKLKFSPRD